jgi:hypothetical protein
MFNLVFLEQMHTHTRTHEVLGLCKRAASYECVCVCACVRVHDYIGSAMFFLPPFGKHIAVYRY